MTAMDSRHVVVTGANGGVGLAVCQWLTDAGAEVYALDRLRGPDRRAVELDHRREPLRNVLTCQTFGRIMLQQGNGRIVTIASMSGNHIVNRPQKQAAYNASKAAVTALSESLAAEWAPRGIRVNALSPGYIATPMVQSKKDLFDTWVEQIPFGRMATPQETAAAVGFLLSDDAAYFVGSELLMDGGYSLW